MAKTRKYHEEAEENIRRRTALGTAQHGKTYQTLGSIKAHVRRHILLNVMKYGKNMEIS
jgi:hypothetical protein